jgi:hypothetical protein
MGISVNGCDLLVGVYSNRISIAKIAHEYVKWFGTDSSLYCTVSCRVQTAG